MSLEEARRRWRELHRACKTVAQEVEMTQTAEYAELVRIIFPEHLPKKEDKQ